VAELVVLLHEPDGGLRALSLPAGRTLLESLQSSGVAITTICHGRAICGMCRVQVDPAGASLPSPGPNEQRLLNVLPDHRAGRRLACQIVLDAACDGLTIALAEPARRSHV